MERDCPCCKWSWTLPACREHNASPWNRLLPWHSCNISLVATHIRILLLTSTYIGSHDAVWSCNEKVVFLSAPGHVESPQHGSSILYVIQNNGLETATPGCISPSQQPHKRSPNLNYASLNLMSNHGHGVATGDTMWKLHSKFDFYNAIMYMHGENFRLATVNFETISSSLIGHEIALQLHRFHVIPLWSKV